MSGRTVLAMGTVQVRYMCKWNPQPTPFQNPAPHSRSRSRQKKGLPHNDSEEGDNERDDNDDDDDEFEEQIHIDNRLLTQLVEALRTLSRCGGTPNIRKSHHQKSRVNEDLRREKHHDQPDEHKEFLVRLAGMLQRP
jgi:hypothetical protein